MMRLIWRAMAVILLAVLVHAPGNTAAQEGNEPWGVGLVIENADQFEPNFEAILIIAIPPEWQTPDTTLPRYEIHIAPSLRTSTCQYINYGDIILKHYSVEATIIDVQDGVELGTQVIESDHLGCPTQVAQITTAYPNRVTFQRWLLDTLSEQDDLPVPFQPLHIIEHVAKVKAAAFSPDARFVATVTQNRFYLWEMATGDEVYSVWDAIIDIEFSPDGRRLATANVFGESRIWDASTGEPLYVIDTEDYYATAVAFSPDGRFVVSANSDGAARVWDVETGAEVMSLSESRFTMNRAIFSPTGRYVVVTRGHPLIWNIETGALVFEKEGIFSAISPDERFVAVRGAGVTLNKKLTVWSLETGEQVLVLEHPGSVSAAEFSPDGRFIATVSADSLARVWDAETGELVHQLSHEERVSDVRFSPDGELLLTTVFLNPYSYIWSVETGTQLLRLQGHPLGAVGVRFSADGRYILTYSTDKTARIWDISRLYAPAEP